MLPFQFQLPAGDLPPVQVWSGDAHYRDVIGTGLSPSVHGTSCRQGHGSEVSRVGDSGHRVRCSRGRGYVGAERKKALTSLVDPERGAQVAVKSTLGCGHLHTDVDNTVIS